MSLNAVTKPIEEPGMLGKNRYSESTKWLARAEKTIPLGTQTFSKSKLQFPVGSAPLYIERGEGANVWDIDGNKYTDYVNSLAAVSLGYNDPDVNQAILSQLKNGISFTLPHRLEAIVSEKLVDMIPCAEMVRFGKNGSDVTAGAIRVARAATGREHIAVCGYHGWQDWYIGSTSRHKGVPEATRSLTHTFQYNDIDSLHALFDRLPGKLAAVILEPMNTAFPQEGFLHNVQKLCKDNDCVLIFDEMITGFRYANGGAQAFFDVTPDLATFGKALGNGMPISALVGKRELMCEVEKIFFSFTFGGETLSLAAADAVLTKYQNQPVIQKLYQLGDDIVKGFESITRGLSDPDLFVLNGNKPWTLLGVNTPDANNVLMIKSLLVQEMARRDILMIGSHNVSYAHTSEQINQLVKAYAEILPWIEENLIADSLASCLEGELLQPVFSVR